MPRFSYNVVLHARFDIHAKHAEEAEIRLRNGLHMANQIVILYSGEISQPVELRLIGDLVIVDDIKLDQEADPDAPEAQAL